MSQGQEWSESGFPPRTFPVGAGAALRQAQSGRVAVGGPAGPPMRDRTGRGRWLAVAAGLIALLLLATGLVLANRGGDDDSDLAAGSSTSSAPVPTFETTSVVTPSSIEPVVNTTAPSSPAVGVLEISSSTLTIPRVDATAGPQSARLTLRNNGSGPLSYTTETASRALSTRPSRGNIASGGAVELTVTLDGATVSSEGPFTATLSIGGTGGAKTAQVKSSVGRPPQLTEGRIVNSLAQPNPCTTRWFYLVKITDASPIRSARVIARVGSANADTELVEAGQAGGASGNYQSKQFDPLPRGSSLRFAIEAFDQLGFGTRLPEQNISC